MADDFFKYDRKSLVLPDRIYFWTATIHKWNKLLLKNAYKQVIISSLRHLVQNGKIDVFAFVIMPNHIHLIWRIKEQNGKESPVGSFLKYTAHAFKKLLITDNVNILERFTVNASNKTHEFWQRDSLAIELFSGEVAFQKLDYIHNNPCTEYWQLAKEPVDYEFSSAKFYEAGINEFDFVKDLRLAFD